MAGEFYFLDGVSIYPGSNTVSSATWEQLQAHPITGQKVKLGAFKVLNLRDKSDRILWMKGLWELAELRELLYREKDEEVKQVIESQIKALVNARFPEKFIPQDPGQSKGAYVTQCVPPIYRQNFGVPNSLDLINKINPFAA